MKKWIRRLLAAAATALVPLTAKADAITAVAIIAEIVGSGAVAVAIVSFVIQYGFLLATIALSVYGSVSARRKAAEQQAAARASYNANLVDRVTTLLQASPPWRVVYGKCIVGGDIIAIFTSDKLSFRELNNEQYVHADAYKHLVIHLATHEVEAFHDMLIGGVRIGERDAEGWVLPYAEGTAISYVTSSAVEIGGQYIPLAGGEGTVLVGDKIFFTGDSTRYTIAEGITGPGQTIKIVERLRYRLEAGVTCTLGNEFAKRTRRFKNVDLAPGAAITFDGGEQATGILASYTRDSGGDYVQNPDPTISGDGLTVTNTTDQPISANVQYTAVESLVRVTYHTGTLDQTVDTFLNTKFPNKWTTNHRLPGIAYAVVTLDLEDKRFQGGPPAMAFEISGRKVFDPRTSTTAWSDNPALIIRDFLLQPWGFECTVDDIDDSYTIAAANACDEVIAFTTLNDPFASPSGDTTVNEKRYTCNGAFTTLDGPENLLGVLSDSMAGVTAYGGRWLIMPGVWTTSVMDLTDDDLDGQISVTQVGTGLDEIFNGAHGTYMEDGRMSPQEAVPYQNAAYLAADGRELWSDFPLNFTNKAARVQNLLRIFTERNREGLIITYPAKLRAWPLRVGDRVRVTSEEYGFDNKYFRVTDWQFGLSSAVNLTLQEDGAATYDSADAISADQFPNTELPSPYFVAALTGLAADSGTAQLLKLFDGTIIPRVYVSWDPVVSSYVIPDGHIEISWQLAGTSTWNIVELPGDETSTYLTGVRELTIITIRAVVVNTIGVRSNTVFVSHTVIGKTAPPADVTSFSSVVIPGVGMKFTWDPNLEVDYLETELHLEAEWHDNIPTPLFVGRASSFIWTTPLSGTFPVLAKHRDTSGNMSVNAALVNSNVPVITPPADGAPGTDGVTALLSNEAHTVPANALGEVLTFAGADTYMRTFLGSIEDTANWTYSKVDFNVCSLIDFNHVTVTAWGDSCGVKLLVHANEADGTLVPADSSTFEHVLVNGGTNVHTGPAGAFAGNALQFSGNANNFLKIIDYSELLPGDADFSIQIQMGITDDTPATRQHVLGIWGPGDNPAEHSYAVMLEADRHISFDYSTTTGEQTAIGPILAVGLNQVGIRRVAGVLTITVISDGALPGPGTKTVHLLGYVPTINNQQGTKAVTLTGRAPTVTH